MKEILGYENINTGTFLSALSALQSQQELIGAQQNFSQFASSSSNSSSSSQSPSHIDVNNFVLNAVNAASSLSQGNQSHYHHRYHFDLNKQSSEPKRSQNYLNYSGAYLN